MKQNKRRPDGFSEGDDVLPVTGFPPVMRTEMACVYLGGISAKTLMRVTREFGICSRSFPGRRACYWLKEELDRLIRFLREGCE